MSRQSRRQTIAYSFGQLGAGFYGAFNTFTLPLYLSLFTQNNILIGWLSSTRSFEQCLIQPLVGAASDKTWTRVGRRAPFFLTTMPIAAVLLMINGWIPHDPAYLWVAVVTIFTFSLLYNVGIDPYYALLIDTTPPEHRGAVNGIAQVVGFAGNIILLLLSTVLWETHPDWVFYAVAAALVIGFGVVALGVRERRDAFDSEHAKPKEPRAPYLQGHRRAALVRWLGELNREHHEAMKLLGVKFLYEFGISAALPFLSLFIVEDVGLKGWPEFAGSIPGVSMLSGIDAGGLSQLIAAFLLLTTMISALPSGLLGDRFGKKKVFAAGLLILGVGGIFASMATSIPQLLLFLALVGLGNGARIVLYQPFLGDLIPASKAGTFTGLSAFAETAGVFLAIFIAGSLLNLNPLGLHYRIVFILTGLFVLAGFVAAGFVKAHEPADLAAALPSAADV